MSGVAVLERAGKTWLPRAVHPVAWWIWALGLTTVASRTTNPVVLGTVVAVACWVALARRPDAPWAQAFRLYLLAGLVVVVLRVAFRVLFGGGDPGFVLLHLPSVSLPAGAHIEVLGNVTAQSLLAGCYDGLRLGTMLVCLGSANALANPRRLLRSLPPALHEVATATVVALSVFPQLAESLVRVRRARRLRPHGHERRVHRIRSVVIPVLEDALDRSLLLAASMDSRGYGRTGGQSRQRRWATGALLLAGLSGLCVGMYAMLDQTAPRALGAPVLIAAVLIGAIGLRASGSTVRRTVYRPDPWGLPEAVVIGSGIAAAVIALVVSRVDPANINPSLDPLAWPTVPLGALLGVLVALLPAFATPLPEAPPIRVET